MTDRYKLQPRQDLAVHRYTQYCGSKSILLVHSVGSGKTLTSLTMALNSFTWGGRAEPARRIIVVAPSGVFKNFIDDLTMIEGISEVSEVRDVEEIYKLNGTLKYSASYHGRPFSLYSYKYSNFPPMLTLEQDIMRLKQIVKDNFVILDEAHRLCRFSPALNKSLLDALVENGIMSGCKKFVAMTGTPYNSKLIDILSFIKFLECVEPKNNETPELCFTNSRYIENNYVIKGGWTTEQLQRVDYWVGGACYIFNVIPDFISTDRIISFNDLRSYLSKRIELNKKKGYGFWSAYGLLHDDTYDNVLEAQIEGLEYILNDSITKIRGGNKDEYEIFGINKEDKKKLLLLDDETYKKEIKKIYKQLAIKYHPDKCGLDIKLCEDKFKEISNAYERLKEKKENKLIDIMKILSEKQICKFIDIVYTFLSSEKYIKHLIDNASEFSKMYKNFSSLKDYVYIESVLLDFKDLEKGISNNVDKYVKESLLSLNPGKDPLLSFLSYAPIKRDLKEITSNSIKLLKGGNSSWITRDTGLGGWLRYWFRTKIGVYEPIKYKELAEDSLPYISLIDTDMRNIDIRFSGKKDDVLSVYIPGKNKGNLELMDIKEENAATLYKYPKKQIVMMFVPYTQEQNEFMYDLQNLEHISNKQWNRPGNKEFLRPKKDDIRNQLLRCVGNYSKDFDKYSAKYQTNISIEPKYEIVNPNIEIQNEPFPERVRFDCPKFRRALLHLLLMKTGIMYTPEGLETQPHLTRDIFIDSLNGTERRYSDLGNYDPQDSGVIINQHTKISYPKFITNISYNDAERYFLPLVWSIGGKEYKQPFPGINVFAEFLNSLNLQYIVLHTDPGTDLRHDRFKILEREKKRVINKTYSIIKNEQYLRLLVSDIYKNTTNPEFMIKILELIELFPDLTREPLCALIDPEMTEGIDCKHNPAIMLLEPPNTLGDLEQLCGRVLRTYSGGTYVNRPKKIVYQFASYNPGELPEILDMGFKTFETDDSIKQKGLGLFIPGKNKINESIFAAIELEKEELGRYVPNGKWEYIKLRYLNSYIRDRKYIHTQKFKKFWNRLWGTLRRNKLNLAKADYIDEAIKEYENINTELKLPWFDTFAGETDYRLAVLNKRVQDALRQLHYKIDTFTDFQKIVSTGRSGKKDVSMDEKLAREQLQKIGLDKLRAECNVSYGEFIHYTKYLTNNPDLDRIRQLQAEEYQFGLYTTELKNLGNPDIIQINNCVEVLPNKEKIKKIPWCDPFIKPTQQNKQYVCKNVQEIESIDDTHYNSQLAKKFIKSIDSYYDNPTPDNRVRLNEDYTAYKNSTNFNIRYRGETENWFLPNNVEHAEQPVLPRRLIPRIERQDEEQNVFYDIEPQEIQDEEDEEEEDVFYEVEPQEIQDEEEEDVFYEVEPPRVVEPQRVICLNSRREPYTNTPQGKEGCRNNREICVWDEVAQTCYKV